MNSNKIILVLTIIVMVLAVTQVAILMTPRGPSIIEVTPADTVDYGHAYVSVTEGDTADVDIGVGG